jgi:hypothetical protein
MGQMSRDISKVKILRADELDWWSFKHGVMLFANIASIFDGFLEDVVDVLNMTW